MRALQAFRGCKRTALNPTLSARCNPSCRGGRVCTARAVGGRHAVPVSRDGRGVDFASPLGACDSAITSEDDVPAAPHNPLSLGWAPGFHATYTLLEELGRGSFGVVHAAVHNASGARYAVKVLRKFARGHDQVDAIRREVAVWLQAQGSAYVVRLVGLYEDDACAYIVQELCVGGDVRELLRRAGRLPEQAGAAIMRGVLDVLVECHRRNVVYGDLKPANFLLQPASAAAAAADGAAAAAVAVRAVDFGCSHLANGSSPCRPCCGGTPLYSPPEAPHLRRSSVAVDVWAAGVMLYQLLTGRLPFWQNKSLEDVGRLPPYEVLAAVRTHDISYPRDVWAGLTPEARDLVGAMLQRNPAQRITAEAALAHPWFGRVLGYAPEPSGDAAAGASAALEAAAPNALGAAAANNVVGFGAVLRRAPSTPPSPALQPTSREGGVGVAAVA